MSTIRVSWTTQRPAPASEPEGGKTTHHHHGFVAQFLDGIHAVVVEEKVVGRTTYSFHVVRIMDLSIYGVEHGR